MLKFLANFKRVKGIRDGSQNLPSKKKCWGSSLLWSRYGNLLFHLDIFKKIHKDIFGLPPTQDASHKGRLIRDSGIPY